MLVVMIGIRKSLDLIFTRRELKILDDIMPEMTKRNQHDAMDVEVGWRSKLRKFCCSKMSALTQDRTEKIVTEKM